MKLVNGAVQIIFVEMGVNLGGENGFMSEHLLHGSQIGPSVDQVSGK